MNDKEAWEQVKARLTTGWYKYICHAIESLSPLPELRERMLQKIRDHDKTNWPRFNPRWTMKVRIAFCNRVIRELS